MPGGLPDFQQVDIVRVVNIAHDATNWVGGLRRLADAVVFELGELRAAIAEDACHLGRIRARPGVLIIGLAGIGVPNAVLERLLLAGNDIGKGAIGVVKPVGDLRLGVIAGSDQHRLLVPVKGVGEVKPEIGERRARSVRPDRWH